MFSVLASMMPAPATYDANGGLAGCATGGAAGTGWLPRTTLTMAKAARTPR